MSLNWTTGSLAKGLACYRREEFFDAHEHWEEIWRKAEGMEKTLFQALIQLSVAFCHRQRGNRSGTLSLLSKSLQRLQRCPDECAGVYVLPLRAEVGQWQQWMESEALQTPHAYPQIVLHSM